MKKLMMILVVLALAIPAMAAITVDVEDIGGGKMQVSYTTDGGELPRGIALEVTLTGGYVASAADVVSVDPLFNCYIDYANSFAGFYDAGINNATSHPLAYADDAGAYGSDPTNLGDWPASTFVISLGALDEDGDGTKGEAGPASSSDLITLQLSGAGASVGVAVVADTTRGGIVGDNITDTTPITINVEDVALSAPACPKDLNGDGVMALDDITVIVLAIKDAPGYSIPANGSALDLNGDGVVALDDITVLVLTIKDAPGYSVSCPQ